MFFIQSFVLSRWAFLILGSNATFNVEVVLAIKQLKIGMGNKYPWQIGVNFLPKVMPDQDGPLDMWLCASKHMYMARLINLVYPYRTLLLVYPPLPSFHSMSVIRAEQTRNSSIDRDIGHSYNTSKYNCVISVGANGDDKWPHFPNDKIPQNIHPVCYCSKNTKDTIIVISKWYLDMM